VAEAVRAPLAQRAVPLVLLVALAALVATATLELQARKSLPRAGTPQIADPAEPVDAWVADAAGVRLTRLYPEEGRQRFESQALRTRLDLEEGELFLLRRDGAAGLVGRAEVRDEHGLALATIERETSAPVGTLFSTPRGVVRGSAREWVLWGRAPHGAARAYFDGVEAAALESTRIARSELRGPLAHVGVSSGKGKNADARTSEGSSRE
jgi:hypothetical protein